MKSKSSYEYKFNPASNDIPEYELQENPNLTLMLLVAVASPFIAVILIALLSSKFFYTEL